MQGFYRRCTSLHLYGKESRCRPIELRADALRLSYKSGLRWQLPPHSRIVMDVLATHAHIQALSGDPRNVGIYTMVQSSITCWQNTINQELDFRNPGLKSSY